MDFYDLLEWVVSHIYIFVILFVVLFIGFIIWAQVSWEKQIKSIKAEFDLVEGCYYNVTQNGGRTFKNLVFVKIYMGNQSKNGDINLLFTRKTKYRDGTTTNNVVIKYGSIWKVEKLD